MWQALFLGVVQGLTEFLPVSSSGHLVVVSQWLQVSSSGAALPALLHIGTLVAVVVMLRGDLAGLVRGLLRHDASQRRLFAQLTVATLPAAAVGALVASRLDAWLFRPEVAAVGFLATTGFIWCTPRRQSQDRSLDRLRWRDALLVGGVQALALLPGLSRSGSTMVAARWAGLQPDAAARLSFLLALPITAGAAAVNLPSLARLGMDPIIGAAAAAISGVVAIQWALKAIRSQAGWRRFGVYTLAMALVAGLGG